MNGAREWLDSSVMSALRIVIADDHEVVRKGVVGMLAQEGWDVCGEAATGREALAVVEKLRPDLAIIDISMPELNGIETTRQIRKLCPETRVLVFSMHYADRLVQDVFQAGADGYVLKSDAGRHLVSGIKAVMAGKRFVSSEVSDVIFDGFLRASNPVPSRTGESEVERLTARERETVQLLAEGKSNKEVATILGISVKTAETHRAAIMRKLKLAGFSDLVRYAIRNGIIEA